MADNPIQKLEEHVINRIAAGEIIVRPSSAVKELIENSLDAGSQSIVITAQKGGMKSLRIEDDGHGIRADDLPILCERFTTSKLRTYEDLSQIGTFGFRGEALSSISHVAHVLVNTRRKEECISRNASYVDGIMQGEPKNGARDVGTTIVFEDLFYNMETRRNVISNANEEYNKIVEVTQKYATHNPRTAFMCKKFQGNVADLRTTGGLDHKAVVEQVYGAKLANHLLEYTCISPSPSLVLEARGLVSNCSWSSKKMELVLFINNRLVESNPIKRMIDAVYSAHLPKGAHPWVYVSIQLDPKTVDVNVHPTKKEVQFLEQDLILEHMRAALDELLEGTKESRVMDLLKDKQGKKRERPGGTEAPELTRVRVDTKQLRLNDMSRLEGVNKISDWVIPPESKQLWEAVQQRHDENTSKTITHSVWVGVVDDQMSLIQYGSGLYLVNMLTIGQEFAYQMLLRNCTAQARWVVDPPCPLKEVFIAGLRDPSSGFSGSEEDTETLFLDFSQWTEQNQSLLEPFGYDFSEGHLRAVPKVFPFAPSCPRPLLLLRMWKGKSVEDSLRLTCRDVVETICELPEAPENARIDLADLGSHLLVQKLWEMMHLSFLSLSEDYLADGSIVRLCALEQLYKIFERC